MGLSLDQLDEAGEHAEVFLRHEPDHVDAYVYGNCTAMGAGDRDRADALIRSGRAVEGRPDQSGHAALAVMADAADPFEAVDRLA